MIKSLDEKMDACLLELERIGWEVLDVKTLKEKDSLSKSIFEVKGKIRKLAEEKNLELR